MNSDRWKGSILSPSTISLLLFTCVHVFPVHHRLSGIVNDDDSGFIAEKNLGIFPERVFKLVPIWDAVVLSEFSKQETNLMHQRPACMYLLHQKELLDFTRVTKVGAATNFYRF